MENDIFSPLTSREPISKIIADQIEDAILAKKFPVGSKLPSEAELCEKFNVSRTPLREALKMLSANGLISIYKGKGVYVNELKPEGISLSLSKYLKQRLDEDYVLDVIRARQILEPSIAYSASLNRTDNDIAHLEESIKELRNCEDDYEKLSKIDMSFHLTLANAAGNKSVPVMMNSLYTLMPAFYSTVYATNKEAKELAINWHTKILTYVKQRNAGEATLAMTEHLKHTEEHTRSLIEEGLTKKS